MKVLGILFFVLLAGCQPASYKVHYEKKQNGVVFEETRFSPGIPAQLANTLTALVVGQKETIRIEEKYLGGESSHRNHWRLQQTPWLAVWKSLVWSQRDY